MEKHINLPLTSELAKTLKAGDKVYLTGTIYTSRDAGHKRMCEALAKGEALPFDPTDATIYYVGPTPAKPGQVIGSAGPTTSGRMDAYAPTMMSVGARGMIGKGARLPEVVEAMKHYNGACPNRDAGDSNIEKAGADTHENRVGNSGTKNPFDQKPESAARNDCQSIYKYRRHRLPSYRTGIANTRNKLTVFLGLPQFTPCCNP